MLQIVFVDDSYQPWLWERLLQNVPIKKMIKIIKYIDLHYVKF